jgi:uncharacterized protein with beta-barrel porin domain
VEVVIDDVLSVQEFAASHGNNPSLANFVGNFMTASFAQAPTSASEQLLFSYLQNFDEDQMVQFLDDLSDSVQSGSVSGQVVSQLTQNFSDVLNGHIAQRHANVPALSMLNGITNNPHVLAQVQDGQPQDNAPVADQVQDVAQKSDWAVFAKAYGLFANQDSNGQTNGYSSDTVGAQFGMDCQVNDKWLLGFAVDYATTDVTLDSAGGSIDISSLRIGPFASYASGPWNVNASLTYGNHDSDSEIQTGLTGLSRDSYQASDVSFYLGGGYDMKLNETWTFTPTASLSYTYYQRDTYTQSATALEIESQDTNALHTRLGIKLAGQFKTMNMIMLPEVSVGWEHEYIQDDSPVNANYNGAYAFSTATVTPDENSVFFGAGLTALINDSWSAYVRYDGTIGDNSDVHAVTGGVRFDF